VRINSINVGKGDKTRAEEISLQGYSDVYFLVSLTYVVLIVINIAVLIITDVTDDY
jgi:hypothetical protein